MTTSNQHQRQDDPAEQVRIYLSWVPADHAKAAHAALDGLLEQLEALREALQEIDRYAMRFEGGSVVGAGRLARAALASSPATKPELDVGDPQGFYDAVPDPARERQ